MTKIEFDNWVDEMGKKFYYDNNVYKNYIDGRGDDRGVIIMYNFKNQKIGIARCHPDDTFVYKIGVAIAYARCKGIEVPKISTYKKFCELKNGDRFRIQNVPYFFIGKCYNSQGDIIYAVQNLVTYKIERIGTGRWNEEVEMVE